MRQIRYHEHTVPEDATFEEKEKDKGLLNYREFLEFLVFLSMVLTYDPPVDTDMQKAEAMMALIHHAVANPRHDSNLKQLATTLGIPITSPGAAAVEAARSSSPLSPKVSASSAAAHSTPTSPSVTRRSLAFPDGLPSVPEGQGLALSPAADAKTLQNLQDMLTKLSDRVQTMERNETQLKHEKERLKRELEEEHKRRELECPRETRRVVKEIKGSTFGERYHLLSD